MRAKRLVSLTGLGLALALTGATTSLAAATMAPAIEAPLVAAHGRAIPGQFIVVLKAGQDTRAVAAAAGAGPRHVYDAALNGFAATLNARASRRDSARITLSRLARRSTARTSSPPQTSSSARAAR